MHEENFYTVRAPRASSLSLFAEVEVLNQKGALATARSTEIEYHLARGDEQFHKRHYFEALKEYKLALGLIYQLIEPTFNPHAGTVDDIRFPVTAALFEPLAATALGVVDRSPDTVPKIAITPPIPADPLLTPALVALRDLGASRVSTRTDVRPDIARDIQLANENAQGGQFDRAIPFYTSALDKLGNQGQPALIADLRHNLGVAFGETRQFNQALGQLEQASRIYSEQGDTVAQAAVQENVASVHTRAGNYDQARQALDAADRLYTTAAAPAARRNGDAAPAFTPHDLTNATVRLSQQRNSLGALTQRTSFLGRVTSRIQRGIEPSPVTAPAFTLRPLATPAITSTAGVDASAGSVASEPRMLRVVTGFTTVENEVQPQILQLDLAANNRVSVLQEQLYARRVNIRTLAELGSGGFAVVLPDWDRIHLPHHFFFTVQVCLGDVYMALGQFAEALRYYTNARDYSFLNLFVEAPNLWIRMSRCLLNWGADLYRKNQIPQALEKLQMIIAVSEAGELSVPTNSPLFNRPGFTQVEPGVRAFIQSLNDPAPAALNPEMAIIIRQARVYQDMIHAGLNILGLPLDLIPIFRFRYLQAVARYFAEQAIKAERDYISFKTNNEQETASLIQLKQAEDLARDNVELERRRVQEANLEKQLADASKNAADRRVANATVRRNDYVNVSADKVALDTATAHASGGFTETEGGYQVNLTTEGRTVNLGDEDYEIMRNAAWHRGMIQRQFELDDMQRTIAEYGDNAVVAQRQVAVSAQRQRVAQQNQVIAELRLAQAAENREFAEDKTFNAELWGNLADRMREISQLYLDRAIEIALMMQAAYNFESDTDLSKIGTNYTTGEELSGLLGGDTLLADINFFTFHHITQIKSKEIPAKTVLSLADRYPFSLFQLRRTGLADFETKLEDFDRLYPGSYMHKIRSVEVVVEGLISADGWSGCLKNSSTSVFRTRDNDVKIRLQPSETLLLSSYSVKGDAIVFRPSDEELGIFEGSGVATAWTLDIPRGSNDLNFNSISDVKLLLYYHSYFDDGLETTVRAALPANGTRARSFSLRFNYPDAFFLMLERGETDFVIQARDFPFNQTNPSIRRIALYVLTEDGVPAEDIRVVLANENAAHEATVDTGVDGTAASDPGVPGAPLNVFVNDSPIDSWSISLDREANPELFREEPAGSGIFRVSGIRDIIMALDYEFAFRQ